MRRGGATRVEPGPMFVRKKRGSAARRKPKSKAKTPRAKARGGGLHLPHALEQRHLDLIGLLLIAAGVFLSFVLFFGWDGGKVGYGLETALVYLSGAVGARIVTVFMLVVGGLLVTGTSISTLVRGVGRGLRRVFLGSRGVAQTAIQSRRDRPEERTFAFETEPGPRIVRRPYPGGAEVAPPVFLSGEPGGRVVD